MKKIFFLSIIIFAAQKICAMDDVEKYDWQKFREEKEKFNQAVLKEISENDCSSALSWMLNADNLNYNNFVIAAEKSTSNTRDLLMAMKADQVKIRSAWRRGLVNALDNNNESLIIKYFEHICDDDIDYRILMIPTLNQRLSTLALILNKFPESKLINFRVFGKGRTGLMQSVLMQNAEMVKLYLGHSQINIEEKDYDQKTAHQLAQETGNKEVLALFEEFRKKQLKLKAEKILQLQKELIEGL